ncbi:MAG: DUF4339 domain-containing protein [Planctomycetota bacterium]
MSDLWYVRTSKRDRGPYDKAKVLELAAEGKIKPEMLVSRDGKLTWVKAAKIKGIEFGAQESTRKESNPRRAALKSAKPEWDPKFGGAPAKLSHKVVDSYGDRLAARGNMSLARFSYGGFFAIVAAGAAYFLVRLLRLLGIIQLDTIEKSLFVRIGIPLIAAVVVFGWAWWRSGKLFVVPSEITHDMTDEEIADALLGK